jgi:phage terminase large subunit-like protein
LPAERVLEKLKVLSDRQIAKILYDWEIWARDDQLEPECRADGRSWRTWLLLGGRGAGKTRAGSEWIRRCVAAAEEGGTPPRIALVGETIQDVRSVMIEGVSGLLAVHPDRERPMFEPSNRRVVWPNGAIAQIFSAEDPDSLRGPQFHLAWCDEVAKWRHAEATWDMLQFGLRLGNSPQQMVTTTPRPIPLLKALSADPATAVTRARTADNAANLAPSFVAEMERRYGGTALGRQELLGEMIANHAGALWRRDWIEQSWVTRVPELRRIVVAVDPPVTATDRSDLCGIVAAGKGVDGRYYVIADRSIQGATPDTWARTAISVYTDLLADCLVAEVNQGGDLVQSVIAHIEPGLAVKKVRATRGKWVRAEPVAALYAERRVSHAGRFPELEEQMLVFGTDAWPRGRSPDRIDALVWAIKELVSGERVEPSIRLL